MVFNLTVVQQENKNKMEFNLLKMFKILKTLKMKAVICKKQNLLKLKRYKLKKLSGQNNKKS